MQLHQLKYFLAILEYESISRAAKSLFLSQPALSQQIKALESELGVKLFNRAGKKLILTDAGKIFSKSAFEALGILQSGKEKLAYLKQGFSSTLSIGISRTSSIEYIPFWINKFINVYPDTKFRIYTEEISELITLMDKNTVDLSFTRNLPKDEQFNKKFDCMMIKYDKIVAVVPPELRWKSKNSLSLKDFDGQNLILRHNLEKNILDRCLKLGIHPSVKCLCNDVVTTIMMVNQNVGIGLVPESCKCLFTLMSLQTYEIDELQVNKKCYVVYPKNSLTASAKNLLKIILSENYQDSDYFHMN